METTFNDYLCKLFNATDCEEVEIIQRLWSGYGKIARYSLQGAKREKIVVKCIDLNAGGDHPRGWNTNFSHQRKLNSYKIETNWYHQYNNQCPETCQTPQFLGSFDGGGKQWIVLEDLDLNFPKRKQQLNINELKSCLKWLANFHAHFMNKEPHGLWPIGTYWHLATRPDEFEKIADEQVKAMAPLIDEKLNNARFKTFVHGDAKVANFCFAESGEVAAVDFQYVGGGCGMKDVAYLLGSCLSEEECELFEGEALDYYFKNLRKILGQNDPNFDLNALEEEWRALFPLACADFTRFLLGWMPNHQKVNSYSRKKIADLIKFME